MSRAEDLFKRLQDQGESAIDRMIADQEAEGPFLDFKTAPTAAADLSLHRSDRNNLAKAISGFGNSEGGVILWGVKAKVAAEAKPGLQDAPRFLSLLQDATSGCTIPPHSGVQHQIIADRFASTLVPPFVTHPVAVALGEEQGRYFIRAGSSFVQMPYAVLSGMFGRRPVPQLDLALGQPKSSFNTPNNQISVTVDVWLKNVGSQIGRDLFSVISIGLPGENCSFGHRPTSGWQAEQRGLQLSVMSPPDYRLPPAGEVNAAQLHFTLRTPFTELMEVRLQFGCDGSPIMEKRIVSQPAQTLNGHFGGLVGENVTPEKFASLLFPA